MSDIQMIISRALRALAKARPYLERLHETTRVANPDWFELPQVIIEIDKVCNDGWHLLPEEEPMASATPAPKAGSGGPNDDFHVVELPITIIFPLTPKAMEWTWEYLRRSSTAIWMRQRLNVHHDDAKEVLVELESLGFRVRKVLSDRP